MMSDQNLFPISQVAFDVGHCSILCGPDKSDLIFLLGELAFIGILILVIIVFAFVYNYLGLYIARFTEALKSQD